MLYISRKVKSVNEIVLNSCRGYVQMYTGVWGEINIFSKGSLACLKICPYKNLNWAQQFLRLWSESKGFWIAYGFFSSLKLLEATDLKRNCTQMIITALINCYLYRTAVSKSVFGRTRLLCLSLQRLVKKNRPQLTGGYGCSVFQWKFQQVAWMQRWFSPKWLGKWRLRSFFFFFFTQRYQINKYHLKQCFPHFPKGTA